MSSINIKFKWKQWYWYFALAVNFGSTLCLGVIAIFQDKLTGVWSWAFVSVTATIMFAFFLVYLIYTTRETRTCRTLIKPERTKFLQLGSLCSFMALNSYWALAVAANQTNKAWIIYIAIALTIIFGFLSSILLTFYEFCASFDVYYHRHKTDIVHDFFRQFDKSEIPEVETVEATESDEKGDNSNNVDVNKTNIDKKNTK